LNQLSAQAFQALAPAAAASAAAELVSPGVLSREVGAAVRRLAGDAAAAWFAAAVRAEPAMTAIQKMAGRPR
jgi:hypothetical protein